MTTCVHAVRAVVVIVVMVMAVIVAAVVVAAMVVVVPVASTRVPLLFLPPAAHLPVHRGAEGPPFFC